MHAEPNVEKASPLKADPVAKDAPAAKTVEPAAKDAPVARGEDGKFVSTKPAEPAEPAKDAAAAKAAAKAAEPVPAVKDAPTAAKEPAKPSFTAEPPPARFSAAAKEKWAEAPDEVRAEVTRAVTELTKGFEKHREAAARDSELAEFHEMATKGGTTVKQALSAYVNMENVLRSDPIKGFELICQNAGLSLRDLAGKILNQTPEESASKADATIAELRAKIDRLEKGFGSIEQREHQAKTESITEIVAKFAADPAHSRFDELSEDIKFFLESGKTKDLAEAYRLAERLNPAPAAPVAKAADPISEPASSAAPVIASIVPAPAHTDRGQKSIAGAPTAGSDPARKQRSSSVQEAIRRAKAVAG
ncbi:hypothetical protein ACRAVF_19010 [Bradyrhizobium oligotrophicum S58]